MPFVTWFLVLGALFIVMALAGSALKRMPFSPAMLYLGVGVLLGPSVAGMIDLDPVADAALLERLSEIAVIVSLFTTGLKLRVPLRDRLWRVPIRLASLGMILTVAGVALVGVTLLGLSVGAALLLGAVLAPTDPVLASDVQVENVKDTETVRFGLTGEAGLNDGTAFPFVMLGLGLLGLHEIGGGWRWFAVDVVWAVGAGLAVGAGCGVAIARLVLWLRARHREALGLDEFLALGLIGLSYGLAILIHAYGFLAVFAAGLALRRTERESSAGASPPDVVDASHAAEQQATDPATAPAHMAQAVLAFNEQFERVAEVALVLCVGAMLSGVTWPEHGAAFLALLVLAIRPLAVVLGLRGAGLSGGQIGFMSWFGVRGVGSLYYLAFALAFGVAGDEARTLADLTLIVIAASIVIHGLSVTPLMRIYQRSRGR
ncbi:MAG: cation:proton antiporter [Nannocystis sp.]|nr:cation:proton antiporter [Nannocystis sp.]MBA3547083.1 cation:proton antiporter [Nannocystis sp.]